MHSSPSVPIIEVNHVTKQYRLGQFQGVGQSVRGALSRMGIGSAPKRAEFNALTDVAFKVESGEVLGIIGTNGAGKSTLLKVLAGITTPTSGNMVARGRVAPLIEVGAGLIADLTGRENIYLNGVILGMTIREVKRKFDEIVAFAELDKFIDTPIKRYSSGMAVRLGFSIATSVDAEILIVDEVLAVGDVAFQRKCFDRIEDIIKKQRKTILLVSHNIRQVERLCTRAILLDHGRILVDGNPRDVCRQFYEKTNAKMREYAVATKTAVQVATTTAANTSSDIELIDIALIDEVGNPIVAAPYRKDMNVEIRFRAHNDLSRPTFDLGIHTSDMLYLATHESDFRLPVDLLPKGEYRVQCTFKRPPLVPGVYSLRLGVAESDGAKPGFYAENLLHFQVTTEDSIEDAPSNPHGFFALDGEWLEPERIVVHDEDLIAA